MNALRLLFIFTCILFSLSACQLLDKVQNRIKGTFSDRGTTAAAVGTVTEAIPVSELLGEQLKFSEGMWMPQQLIGISQVLKQSGLELNPESLTQLTEFPMNAIVSLGGCSASFISPKGLVVTNHHCAYGNIQYNSTKENNLIENGFLAKTFSDELPGAPGSRMYVTESVSNVTDVVNKKVKARYKGFRRYEAIEDAKKKLVQACEKDAGYRCSVYSFYGGLNYFLIKYLEIKDVRLVHAPRDRVGRFGGDIDNWMWPRHTGDYTFYRAYVSPTGQSAEFSKDNVPYQPKSWLKVDADGVKVDDYVMVIGYPGVTNRYRLAAEVEHRFTWYYPYVQKYMNDMIATIEKAASYDKNAEIKYASSLAGIRNYAKNFQGMMDGYAKSELLQEKKQLEQDLEAWIAQDKKLEKKYKADFDALRKLIADEIAVAEREFNLSNINRLALLGVAKRLYRFAKEQKKKDIERESGFQERDRPFIVAGLERLDQRFDKKVDRALAMFNINNYLQVDPKYRVKALDQFLRLDQGKAAYLERLDWMYKNTRLTDLDTRLAWLKKPVEAFKSSDDPFIQLAVALEDYSLQQERKNKTVAGRFAELRPQFMSMLTSYHQKQGRLVYPDANGTLRVTYGKVRGYKPADGKISKTKDGTNGKDAFTPFTTLEGIIEKHTGKDPFNVPGKQLALIQTKEYGEFSADWLKSVPVNFLSTVDITGGNSGSATLNARGELIGLVFDGTYDAINSDWDFNPDARAIHVDIRYMLWNMKYVDEAQHLIDELEFAKKSEK